jgi:hypothetical protein
MENFLNYYPPAPDGNIYLPWGEGACSFIAGEDIGRVGEGGADRRGPREEGLHAHRSLGADHRRRGAGDERGERPRDPLRRRARGGAKKAMLDMGMPAWMVDGMMELHGIDKAGYAAVVTDAVQTITGRAPVSFPAFAQKHAARWKA